MRRSEERELRKYVGDLSQVCGVKAYRLSDGLADGVRALDLRNGRGLELTVLPDRGLDISELRFEGVNCGFFSKTGVTNPAYYQEDGSRGFLKRFYAGMLTTCGMTYAGAACEDEGRALGLHGPFSNTPVEAVGWQEAYEDEEKLLRVRGQVREACVFEENLRLERELTLHTERNVLRIRDTVTNLGFAQSPLMLVYHVNFGYPLLDDGARVYGSSRRVEPRDEIARQGLDKYDRMEHPGIGRPEECFFHTEEPDPERAFAMLVNEKLGMAAILRFDGRVFPLLCEWKCMMAGDYALGLEPTTAGVLGRAQARKQHLPTLAPGETREFLIELELTRDRSLIETYRKLSR